MRRKSIIILIVMLAIGFAAVSATLIINGVVGIATNSNNFIDGVVFDEESLRVTEGATVSLSESGRTITFTTQEMTRIDETATVYFKIKNYSQYDATLGTPAISCYFVDSYEEDKKATKTSETNEYMDLIPGHELDGTKITAGGGTSLESSVTVKQTKSYIGDTQEVKFQCEINASAGDSETPGIEKPKKIPEGVELINDIDGDGRADIGDEIRVGTENFYVISQTATELNALAKYNLNVGEYKNISVPEVIQNEKMVGNNWQEGKKYGTVAFSNNNGWTDENNATIDIKQYDGPIKDALYGENGYEKYIQETIPYTSARLITKGEIETLVNGGNEFAHGDNIEEKAKEKGYSWLYSTTYWTQSSFNSGDVWGVYSHGGLGAFAYMSHDGYSFRDYYGVRPVITIKADLEDLFNITFNANGGNEININKEIRYGNKYGELPTPTHKNSIYTFSGWYTESGEKIETTTIMNKYKDHTLTARWKTNSGYEITNDVNKDGIVDIGDEIQVGTERFYVISYSETELNALAKYNLNVGRNPVPSAPYGIQHKDARGGVSGITTYGTVAFSKANGWAYANNATIDIRNEAYRVGAEVTVSTMTALDALCTTNETVTGYEDYIRGIVPESVKEKISVRLIDKTEVETLRSVSEYTSWLYYTTYWTQTADFGSSGSVWRVRWDGYMFDSSFSDNYDTGVRPVITIPLS